MARWEYKIVEDKVYDEKYLNSLGDVGWELCGIITRPERSVLYFMRSVRYPGPPD